MRKAVTYLVTAAALVLNPFFACHADYRFGMREIHGALDGTWGATVYGANGTTTVVFTLKPGTVEHASGGLVSSAAACGHRDLVANAEACGDTTYVPLVATTLDGRRARRICRSAASISSTVT